MSEWIKWSDSKPKRRQLCDFLYSGDASEPLVWILCSADKADASRYDTPDYWRPAEPLPDGVAEFDYCA